MSVDAAVVPSYVVPSWGAKYGTGLGSIAQTGDVHPMSAIAGDRADSPRVLPEWHPGSPLMAVAVIAALTFGLLAVSGSVRVGKTTAAANVGET